MSKKRLPPKPPPREAAATAGLKGVSVGSARLETRGPRRLPGLQWRTLMAGEATASGAPETALVGVLAGLIEWAEHVGVDFQGSLAKARRAVLEPAGRV